MFEQPAEGKSGARLLVALAHEQMPGVARSRHANLEGQAIKRFERGVSTRARCESRNSVACKDIKASPSRDPCVAAVTRNAKRTRAASPMEVSIIL